MTNEHEQSNIVYNTVIDWLLFNANSAVFQLYQLVCGENKFIFNKMIMGSALY